MKAPGRKLNSQIQPLPPLRRSSPTLVSERPRGLLLLFSLLCTSPSRYAYFLAKHTYEPGALVACASPQLKRRTEPSLSCRQKENTLIEKKKTEPPRSPCFVSEKPLANLLAGLVLAKHSVQMTRPGCSAPPVHWRLLPAYPGRSSDIETNSWPLRR